MPIGTLTFATHCVTNTDNMDVIIIPTHAPIILPENTISAHPQRQALYEYIPAAVKSLLKSNSFANDVARKDDKNAARPIIGLWTIIAIRQNKPVIGEFMKKTWPIPRKVTSSIYKIWLLCFPKYLLLGNVLKNAIL